VALGQAVYLLAILAHRFNHKFESYKINLCGAMSTIQLTSDDRPTAVKELYYNNNEDSFNTALTYLLHC